MQPQHTAQAGLLPRGCWNRSSRREEGRSGLSWSHEDLGWRPSPRSARCAMTQGCLVPW